MQVAKADGLQNHSVRFVGSTPTWRAKKLYWKHTQVVEEDGLENRKVGDELARGFESYCFRKEYLQQIKGKKNNWKLFISSKLKKYSVINGG